MSDPTRPDENRIHVAPPPPVRLTWGSQPCTGLIYADDDLVGFVFGTRQVAATDEMIDWLASQLGVAS